MISRHWNIKMYIQHRKQQVLTVRIVFFLWDFANLNVKKDVQRKRIDLKNKRHGSSKRNTHTLNKSRSIDV